MNDGDASDAINFPCAVLLNVNNRMLLGPYDMSVVFNMTSVCPLLTVTVIKDC